MRRFKGLTILLAILLVFSLIAATGCGSKDPAPAPAPSDSGGAAEEDNREPAVYHHPPDGMPITVFVNNILGKAQKRVDKGTLTPAQADYIIGIALEGGVFAPYGDVPYDHALDNPDEFPIPEGWNGPKYVNKQVQIFVDGEPYNY